MSAMHEVTVNAWEVTGEDNALLALAGHSSMDELIKDREARSLELFKTCAITRNKVGFEIGSGNGLVVRLLSPQCAHLDCNDISESFLSRATKYCADCNNIKFHLIVDGSLGHLMDAHYDFGFALNVFIHFNPYDMFNYLTEVTRLLKPGGIFYFDACTIGEQTADLFREAAGLYRRNPASIRGLLNFNSPEVIVRLVEAVGLNVSDRSVLNQPGWLKVAVTK